jgi:hypothetical protein
MAVEQGAAVAGAADEQQTDAERALEAERKRLLEPTFTVAGKRITLRKRLPASEGGKIYGLLSAGSMDDMLSYAPFLALLIEAWGFEGDPRDVASYDALDVPGEFMPLIREVVNRWRARVDAASPKA